LIAKTPKSPRTTNSVAERIGVILSAAKDLGGAAGARSFAALRMTVPANIILGFSDALAGALAN